MIELSIVAGTYNRLPYLKKMLASVRASVGTLSYEIVLVDGGSTDGTLDYLRKQRDVKLIEHGKLLGAIKAFNDGALAATGRYVVLSNDDIEYMGDALTRAYSFMTEHEDVGIGCFYTNRAGRGVRVDMMPAHDAQGHMTSVYYGGLVIIPRWLGNALDWWRLDDARTYGGDNALCARSIEAGWPVMPIPGAQVDEHIPGDELNAINNPPTNNDHPDTQIYLKLFPRGPEIGRGRSIEPPDGEATTRIVYAPIYEHNHKIQHAQKYGLRKALQRIGRVWEVDYAKDGAEAILDTVKRVKPDIVLTQLHYPEPFTVDHARRLREMAPKARLINWNGDVYDMTQHEKYSADYCAMLRYFDLQTVVNASSLAHYAESGVRATWWQNAYEPEGVGHKPDVQTPHHDVIFLGNSYSAARIELGKVLDSLPYDVGIYGDHWTVPCYPSTLYDFRLGCKLYQNARIAIGDSEWKWDAKGFVSNRPFQAMAAGGSLMMQQWFDGCEDMLGLIDGKHLILWRDHDDLRAKIDYWLDDEQSSARAEISRAGQLEILKHHSFEARIRQLMDMLSTLPNRVKGVDPALIGVEYA